MMDFRIFETEVHIMHFIDMLLVFKFDETPNIRRGHMWHILGKNHRLTKTEMTHT